MRNGLPTELDAVRASAALRNRADRQLTDSIQEAINAGISPIDVEVTIQEADTWPPPLADPDFIIGWETAHRGALLSQPTPQMIAGFEAYAIRGRR